MSISPDYLIERKRTKKQLLKWKFVALALIIAMLFVARNHLPSTGTMTPFPKADHIASTRIDGIIFDDLDRVKKLLALKKDEKIKALIVNINSPGGSVVGSEMLYNALRKIADSKPVVIIMGSLAASGGYMAALGGDYIIAHNGTITGSIGVIMQSAEITELAERFGIKFNNFKSDELKAAPNPTEKLTPEVRQVTMDSIYKVYDYFIEVVANRRNLDIQQVRKLADGRIYSGRQALDLKLIDAIGNEDTAIEWLQEKKGIAKELEVIDVKLKARDRLIDMLMEDFDTKISSFLSSSFKGLKSIIQ